MAISGHHTCRHIARYRKKARKHEVQLATFKTAIGIEMQKRIAMKRTRRIAAAVEHQLAGAEIIDSPHGIVEYAHRLRLVIQTVQSERFPDIRIAARIHFPVVENDRMDERNAA